MKGHLLGKKAFSDITRHRGSARCPDALQHQSGPRRRAFVWRQPRSATYLDGREARRLGGYATHWETCGDQRAVDQRAEHDGGVREAAGPAGRGLSKTQREGGEEFSEILEPGAELLFRRD